MIVVTKKEENYLLVTAPVLVPNEPDCDFMRGEEPLTEEQIRRIAHSYMDYRIIEKNHDYLQTHEEVGVPVESYITSDPTSLKGVDGHVRNYPPGTWMLTMKITDKKSIQKVLNGEYTGVSVTALPLDVAEEISTKESANYLIKDLKNPVGFAVSLVREPCVRSAKFCKQKLENKKNGESMTKNEDAGIVSAIKSALGLDESTPSNDKEYVTKEDFDKSMNSLRQEISEGFSIAVKELKKEKEEEEEETKSTTTSNNSNSNSSSEEEDEEKRKAAEKEAEIKKREDKIKEAEKAIAEEKKKLEELKGTCKANPEEEEKKKEGKGLPTHNKTQAATKSASNIVYAMMGRDSTGSVLPKEKK